MTSIQMPQLGETIVEGTILKWLKDVGDHVDRDEPLFEISTDKVDTEVPSPVAGTVSKILVEEGATVPVGTALMEIDDGSEAAVDTSTSGGSYSGDAGSAESSASTSAASSPGSPAPAAAPAAATVAVGAAAASAQGLPDRGPRSRILSPVVRRLAEEHGLDLASVAGTGEGGRITRKDVEAAIVGGTAAVPAAAPAGAPAAAVAGSVPVPSVATASGEDVQPLSHIRRAIAEHMLASVNETARAWTMVEVNVEHLVRLRAAHKDAFLQRHGVKLTYLPFVVRATVDALQTFPQVNSRIDGDNVVTPRAVNMGIAVSYDAGLIVPVITNADVMNSVGIARAIADLAARARSHQLRPDEVQGATFTITNPGPYGSLVSVPIINQPNVGILSLDAIQKRPVVVDEDAVGVRHMVYISMSWDHRLIDGEIATRFLARVKQNLQSWDFAEDLGL
ncbi:MAG: 2-oxoglutarate dehydrogenase, E2 component, dihydrolipoamide succinyltransferase [Actinomycetota bacterium]